MLTQVGEQCGLDESIVVDHQKLWDLQGKNSCRMIVKEGTRTVFLTSYLIAVVELSHVQLSAPFNKLKFAIPSIYLTNNTPHFRDFTQNYFTSILSVYVCVCKERMWETYLSSQIIIVVLQLNFLHIINKLNYILQIWVIHVNILPKIKKTIIASLAIPFCFFFM